MKYVAIAGFGTVGGGVAEILDRNAAAVAKSAGDEVRLKYIVDLRDMPDSPWADRMIKDFAVVENDPEISVVVEAIGGCGAALQFVRRALAAGKHVVTSNKQLVAEHGTELISLAKEHGVSFLFEAAVGGGIPVLNPLVHCFGANEMLEVSGILNGTTNYILTQMLENGAEYEDALRTAQSLGYAEANPAADVEGIDAGRKICILADLAFGKNVAPEKIRMEGITKIGGTDARFAEKAGMKIKLLGRACLREEGLQVFTAPHFVPEQYLLSHVGDVLNAVSVRGSDVLEAIFYGYGAGRYPTASAVVGDITDILANPGRVQPADWSAEEAVLADPDDFRAGWYFRTKQPKQACEQVLGEVQWLPDTDGWSGGITAELTRRTVSESGLDLAAFWPVYGI